MAKKKRKQDEDAVDETAAESKDEGKKKAPKPRGRKGETWGLSVCATWHKLMKRNFREKLTDEQMAEFMRAEFPKQKKYTANDVAMHRTLFNKGKLKTNWGEIPDTLLTEYDAEGNKVERKRKAPKKKGKSKEDVAEKVDLDAGDDDEDEEDEDEAPPKSRRRRKGGKKKKKADEDDDEDDE